VIGVAQIINKTNDTQEFTPRDVEVILQHIEVQNKRTTVKMWTSSIWQIISLINFTRSLHEAHTGEVRSVPPSVLNLHLPNH
jgi:hypothetical protein